jgi:phage tail-like protein
MTTPPQNPFVGYHFVVEISGIQEARFTECSGLEAKIDVEEYKEGGVNDFVHRLPGRRSFSTLTLKRGMTNSMHLWDWLNRVATAEAKASEKQNISIVLYNKAAAEVLRWNLIGAFPVKWSSPTLQSDQSSVFIETLELTFQEFSVQAR